MKTTTNPAPTAETKARALAHALRCQEESRRAIAARDAIADCFSQEWRAAHATAQTASIATTNAFDHAYRVGAAPRPYWV